MTDNSPAAESRYRVRFHFDPNSISMANTNAHFIFAGRNAAGATVVRVELRWSQKSYRLRAALARDGTAFPATAWFAVTDAWHTIELDWRASAAPGANGGGLTLWVDGVQRANLTGIDNDMRRVESADLGALEGIDTTTRGTYYFDAFESRRSTYIGP